MIHSTTDEISIIFSDKNTLKLFESEIRLTELLRDQAIDDIRLQVLI